MRFITKVLLLASLAATFAYAQTPPHFQHIILIIQENRTPDNLFGSNPTFVSGVDIQQPSTVPWCLGSCFDPQHFHLPDWENEYHQSNGSCPGRGNAGACTNTQTYCNGQPVGPDEDEMHVPSCPQQSYVSGTYDNSVVQPYFDIATKYGFANYFFQTNEGPSMPAHRFLFSGTSAPAGDPSMQGYNFFQAENPLNNQDNTTCTAPAGQTVRLIDPSGDEKSGSQYNVFPCYYHNSLPTLLDAASPSITWRYYTNENAGSTTNGIWNAPAAIAEICWPVSVVNVKCTGSDYVNNVIVNNPAQVLLDLGTVSSTDCNLKNVSWVIPNGDRSDHPGLDFDVHSTSIEAGPAWVADIINAVGQSPCTDVVNKENVPYWQDTAIFVLWDDWGGFYDHVSPAASAGGPGVLINTTQNPCTTFGCGYVFGFRVPLLVVSAYTGTLKNGVYYGYVSGNTLTQGETFPYIHDFGSILAFIENNFLGSSQIGAINAQNHYPFADNFAPDYSAPPNLHVPLADFFPLTSPRPFQAITIPEAWQSYGPTYFLQYNGPVLDPDNDAIDND